MSGPERRARAVALALEHGIDDLYQGVVPALVPLLVVVRHYDLTRAGGIVLAATVLSSVAQPLFGVLADGRRVPWLRTAGMLTAAGGIAAAGVVTTYPATWCAVLVSGLGTAAYHPEAARAVHATRTGDRGMGWFTFGGLAGFAAGPPVAGVVLGGLGLGATPLLALPAVVVAALTGLATLRRRRRVGRIDPASGSVVARAAVEPRRAGPAAETSGGAPARAHEGEPEDWRRFGWLSTVVMTRSVLFYGISAFLVIYLAVRLDAPPGLATVGLTLFTGLGAASTLFSSALSARLGRARTLLASYLLAALALGTLLAAGSAAVALAAVAVLGVALSLPVPVHTTLGQSYLPRHLGLASAVTLGLAVSVGGLASPALGALADHRGIATAMTVLLVLPVLAALLCAPLGAARLRDPANRGRSRDPAGRGRLHR